MNVNGDRERFLIALAAAIVFHLGIGVGLAFIDWSSPSPSATMSIDLGAPVETDIPELEVDEVEPDDPEPVEDPVEAEPEEEEPQPREPEEFEPAETEPAEPEPAPESEEAPAEQAAPEETPEEQPTAEETPEEQPPDEPAQPPDEPARPQGPDEEEVARTLEGMTGSGEAARERPERSPGEPSPEDPEDGDIARARAEAREAFEQALEEERARAAAAADDPDDLVEEGGDPDTGVTARVSDLLGRVRDAPTSPASPGDDGVNGDEVADGEPAGEDLPDNGDGIVTWDGDGDRRLIRYSVPEMDGSDLRATGAPEVRARTRFEVDERGIVRPGSINVDSPGLTAEGRDKLIEAVSGWRFDARPESGIARGSIDFIFVRSEG